MTDSLRYAEYRYGTENELQSLAVWEFPDDEPTQQGTETRYWLIYVHGGYLRDPRIGMDAAEPIIGRLLAPGSPVSAHARIAGFASLNYRLSAHPAFPQDPRTTPPYSLRAARHPDHLRDVRAALRLLQDRVALGHGYILCGHSIGAFLAFQLLMGGAALEGPAAPRVEAEDVGPPLPACIVGLEGVYDLRGLDERLDGAVREPNEGAFGPDRDLWDRVSPGRFRGGFQRNWGETGRLAVLAYSPEDELVDGGEIDTMEAALREGGVRVLALRDLRGRHDEIWRDGREVARVLGAAIAELDRLEWEGG